MGEIRGGGGKAGRWVSKMSQRENVSYDGNAAKELVVPGSIFKEDGVLSSPPLQLPSLCLLTTVHTYAHTHTYARTRREAHLHNPCSSSLPLVLVELTVDEVEFSPPFPSHTLSLSLSLPLSFSICRFHSVFVAHTLSVTVSAHSPSRYFRKIKGDKGER